MPAKLLKLGSARGSNDNALFQEQLGGLRIKSWVIQIVHTVVNSSHLWHISAKETTLPAGAIIQKLSVIIRYTFQHKTASVTKFDFFNTYFWITDSSTFDLHA